MHTKIWRPGTDLELDQLFEYLRQAQYQDQLHPLWKNYSQLAFNECISLSIVFDDDHNPTHCSSMLNRDCWPKKVYRVLNRMWKIDRIPVTRFVSPNICLMIKDQEEWLKNNTDCELIFVSRQYDNWRKMLIRDFNLYSNLEFKTDANKYQTCNDDVDSCWQHIIYHGNDELLEHWNHK
jgi:hypothetical protein